METVKEIKGKTKTSFKVSAIPVETLTEFKKYCAEECGDIYWVGISQLLKTKKQYSEILALFYSLQAQIDQLQTQLNTEKKNVKAIKTFG